jgi:type I restriction enzyme S subunit
MSHKLKDILEGCLFTDGDWIESKDQDPKGEIRLIQLADIGDGNFVDKSSRFINRETALKLKCTFLKKGDVLIARMPDPLGRACVFPLEEANKYVTAVDVCIIRPNEKCLASYLKYTLNSTDIRNTIARQKTGTTRERITRKKLGDLQIPLPPLPTQQKIASILDAADTLRQKDKALLAKYDELTQSLFLDMFGDPVRNEKGWEFKKLNELVSKLGDGLHGTPNYSEDGEYYFVNGNNLDNGKIAITENTKRVDYSEFEKHKKDLNENTMLVSINGTIGKIAFYNNEKIILGKSACYFNLIKGSISELFLFHIFKSDYFLRYSSSLSTGSTIQNVSLKTMREFPIPYPPITLQNQFAERVAVIGEQKAIAQVSLEKSEELFNSLLQKAFKGELV